ncbi:MAG: MFS transporter [Candidatus Helarchaeota archaeon]
MKKHFLLIALTDFSIRAPITLVLLQFIDYYSNFFTQVIFAFLLLVIGQIVGAIAYPVGGWLGDRAKKTKYGRFKPFFIISIPVAITLILASIPLQGLEIGLFIFYCIFLVGFFFLWRIIYPNFVSYYTSITTEDERLELAFLLNIADILAIVVGLALPLVLPISLDYFSYALAIFMACSCLLLYKFGKSEPEDVHEVIGTGNIIESMKKVFNIKNYKTFIIHTFFAYLAYGTLYSWTILYLDSFNLTNLDYMIFFPVLFGIIGVVIILIIKFYKKNHLDRLIISGLISGISFPFLLIFGTTVVGMVIAMAFVLTGLILWLIYWYTIQMKLGEQNKEVQTSFFGVNAFISVLAPPISTLIVGLFIQFLNPINFWIWNGNFGYCFTGVYGGIAFLMSWFTAKKIELKKE